MPRSPGSTRSFLLDNNVYVAAIANPTRRTGALRLILHLVADDGVHLVGDTYQAEEMARYTEVYHSETAVSLLEALVAKTDFVEVEARYLRICREYVGTIDLADVYHAAACLQTGSTLITDDRHFDRIRDEGIIKVWSTKVAVNELLGI